MSKERSSGPVSEKKTIFGIKRETLFKIAAGLGIAAFILAAI